MAEIGKLLDEEQAMAMLEELNKAFNISPCGLRVEHLEYGRRAYYTDGVIFVAHKALDEFAILHEFAHHITDERTRRIKNHQASEKAYRKMIDDWDFGRSAYLASYNLRKATMKSKPKRRKHHAREFIACLKKVAQVFYGNYKLYDWDREYKTVRKAVK